MSVPALILGVALQAQPTASPALRDFSLNTDFAFVREDRMDTLRQRWELRRPVIEADSYGDHDRFLQPLSGRDVMDTNSFGLAVTVSPEGAAHHGFTGWRFVAGFDNERLEISPGAGAAALLYRGGSISVADGYAGLATDFDHGGFITWGYVRQERTAVTGEREWSEDSHFVGMTYQLSW